MSPALRSYGDFYAILKVSPEATFAEIRTAYRRAALLSHPDKGGSQEDFVKVAKAFEVLSRVGDDHAGSRSNGACSRQGKRKAPAANAGETRVASRSRSLLDALERLQQLLQRLPAEDRREMLASLSEPIRARLLEFVHSRAAPDDCDGHGSAAKGHDHESTNERCTRADGTDEHDHEAQDHGSDDAEDSADQGHNSDSDGGEVLEIEDQACFSN